MKNKLFDKLLPIYGLELREKQVCEILNVSIATLYRMRVMNEIKYKKRKSDSKNGTVVYNLLDIIDYVCKED